MHMKTLEIWRVMGRGLLARLFVTSDRGIEDLSINCIYCLE